MTSDKPVKIGKLSNIANRWMMVTLTEEEANDSLKRLFDFNLEQASKCIKTLGTDMEKVPLEMMKTLLDKQLIASFTWLNWELEGKIQSLKDGNYKKDEPKKGSLIDKAMEKTDGGNG
jgi:hypothetical protein